MRATRLTIPLAVLAASLAAPAAAQPSVVVTHGPILGRIGSTHVAVWARTSRPGAFRVRYGLEAEQLDQISIAATTAIDRDNTGWVLLEGLEPGTEYFYQVVPDGAESDPAAADGSFLTLPDAESFRNPDHNPQGLFNFRFEFGTGNNQRPRGSGPWPPAFATMLEQQKGKVHFAILNGDFIYEEYREYPVSQWLEQVGLRPEETPAPVQLAPSLVGVWENYKAFLRMGRALAAWHRNVPSFFTFDDHELIDNIQGTGTVGRRDRKAVFRDIGTKAWYDYLGWANPVEPGRVHLGRARLEAGSDVLEDQETDFSNLDFEIGEPGALHVHWGGPAAGLRARDFAALETGTEGDPNANVHEIVERLDSHRLRIRPAAAAEGSASYSIGRRSYYDQRVSNAHFFFLDTRSHRQVGDVERRDRPDVSMLGTRQREWLMERMAQSDADFFFVVSQVTFMIPHVGGTPRLGAAPTEPRRVAHDEAWPVFLHERERLIDFWDSLDKPVFLLTGDLHNSFSIKITDRIWELASGPHNSRNHRADAQGGPPPNGLFDSMGRECEIRWSSYFLPDVPPALVRQPIYTVVQVNNVFDNRLEPDRPRWVAYPHPQVVVQYFDGLTGDLLYAESILVGQ